MTMRRVRVLGGTTPAATPEFAEAARTVGRLLAENGLTLLYDGAGSGLSGLLAEAALERGGAVEAIVLRRDLTESPPRPGLTELVVTDTSQKRDAALASRSDGVLALPGALQSIRELEPIWDRSAGAPDEVPCGLLNTSNYYSGLLTKADDATLELFARESQRGRLIVERDPETLLRALAEFRPPETRRLDRRGNGDW